MSENIFTKLYNNILGLFGQSAPKEESKNTAVNRLRLVLMQDRTNLTPEIMHKMRTELIGVLSKYVELDKEALELNFEQEGEQMALMLSIPVIRAKDEEEIEKALKEETTQNSDAQEETSETDEEISEETDEQNTDKENANEKSEEEPEQNTETEEITSTELKNTAEEKKQKDSK